MSRAIRLTQDWCSQHGLSINPNKTILLPFHRKRNISLPDIVISNETLKYSSEVTYLGITLYKTLSWLPHLQSVVSKANKTLWALRSLVGKTWGMNPGMILRIYKSMIRPIVTYGSLVWWPAVKMQTGINLCTKLQRIPCKLATGCQDSCRTAPMQALLGMLPLHLHILSTAAKTALRLESAGNNICQRSPIHGSIIQDIPNFDMITHRSDIITPSMNFDKLYQTFVLKGKLQHLEDSLRKSQSLNIQSVFN